MIITQNYCTTISKRPTSKKRRSKPFHKGKAFAIGLSVPVQNCETDICRNANYLSETISEYTLILQQSKRGFTDGINLGNPNFETLEHQSSHGCG
jgi:hypothetical protein